MTTEQKLELIRQVGEEILTVEELRELLEKKPHPIAYDGFEPSGKIHIAQGILRAINVNKMTKAGCKFKMWVADWFAWMNNKMGGDMEKIQTTGNYMIETWKASGMELKNVEFVWAKEAMHNENYWKKVIQIGKANSVARIKRCAQIMGREESDSLSGAQIFYPCMQAADIFHLGADITQLGMDQRKVNVLAREIGEKLGYWKPVVVSHHMLMGLQQQKMNTQDVERAIEMKMSKSIPDSAIFMTDSRQEVERKIAKAYCQEKQADLNPILEYCKYIVFEKFSKMKIERASKFGGDVVFSSYQELEKAFVAGSLHPMDLKKSVSFCINELLEPTRKHFEKGKAKELLEQVNSFEITR